MEKREIIRRNNASAAIQMPQTSGLQQEVVIPIKICKRKAGSRTYFMHPKNFYVVTPLSKLLAKAYSMDKRLKQNPERILRDQQHHTALFEWSFAAKQSFAKAQTHDHGRISTKASVDSGYNYQKRVCALEGAGRVADKIE
ncbi:MAG: hypothetical protein K5780_05050 [Alphaproteobacteria bacterium]|nr:hypothetical protein [Alphaproteobacteria bacterium]